MNCIPETMEKISAAGVSFAHLARTTGLKGITFTAWAKGRRKPTKSSQNKLAAALEATARELLAIAGELRA